MGFCSLFSKLMGGHNSLPAQTPMDSSPEPAEPTEAVSQTVDTTPHTQEVTNAEPALEASQEVEATEEVEAPVASPYNRLGALSIAGENSTADPAVVAQDSGDSGGWSYGLYQFSSASHVVQDFVYWLQRKDDPYDEYGNQLAAAGDPTCDENFVAKWKEIGTIDPGGFGNLQDEYATSLYFDEGANRLLTNYGFNIRERSLSLQQVMFSNCVQHGTYWGSEIISLAAEAAGSDLNDTSDKDLIYYVYEIKLTDMSWSSGAPNDRPGLFARWRRERDEALGNL